MVALIKNVKLNTRIIRVNYLPPGYAVLGPEAIH